MAAGMLVISSGLSRADALLDDWIEAALEQNQEVIAARRAWEAAQQKAPRARSFMDPMVGVEFMRMDSTRLDDYDMAEVMVAQELPWFGKRTARIDTAERMAEVAGYRYLEVARRVRARVITAYWQLWAAQRAVEINRENLELLEQFEDVARARYEAGQGLQTDVLRAQVERDRLETDLLTLEQELEVAQARINWLLSEPGDTPRRVVHPADEPVLPGAPPELYADALRHDTRLRALGQGIKAGEAAVRSARRESTPNFEFRVMARQQSGRSGFQEVDIGVAMNVPWVWRGKYRAAIHEAEAERDRARAMAESRSDMTLLEIKESYTSADAERRSLRLYEEVILPRTRDLLESTRSAYEAGRVTLLELTNAQRAWADANLAYERARMRYAAAVARLEEIAQPWTEREMETGLIAPDED